MTGTESLTDARRQFICTQAPTGWNAYWTGPQGISELTVPNFCPWCGERLAAHPNYLITITTGTARAEDREAA